LGRIGKNSFIQVEKFAEANVVLAIAGNKSDQI
jgi:hypothetical protein